VKKIKDSTVVRTSAYDRRTFPGLRHDVQLTGNLNSRGKPSAVCHPTLLTQPFTLLGSIN